MIPLFTGTVLVSPQLKSWTATSRTTQKKGGPKVKCLLIVKRDRWVAFLHQKKEHTRTKVFDAVEKKKLRTVKHTQGEVRERIAATITAPNKYWAERKKT